jgi:hypothetical protein
MVQDPQGGLDDHHFRPVLFALKSDGPPDLVPAQAVVQHIALVPGGRRVQNDPVLCPLALKEFDMRRRQACQVVRDLDAVGGGATA